jgi:hypothetical protein
VEVRAEIIEVDRNESASRLPVLPPTGWTPLPYGVVTLGDGDDAASEEAFHDP